MDDEERKGESEGGIKEGMKKWRVNRWSGGRTSSAG